MAHPSYSTARTVPVEKPDVPFATPDTRTAQTTLLVAGKLLGTLVIWLALLHTTDMGGVTALITASAAATALTVYLYKTIPLVLAGQKSLGSVAQDMMAMAEQIDTVKTGEVDAFKESADTLTQSVETARASLEVETSPPPPPPPVAPPPEDAVREQLAEAANLLAMGFGIEAAAEKTHVPAKILERLETSGNGEWGEIKQEAKAHMLRRMGDSFQ
jgi:hypothetical protein